MKSFFLKYWTIGCVVLLWFAFAFPYFFKGLVPFPSDYLVSFFPPWNSQYGMPVKNNAMPDVITQIYPWKKLTVETWKSGKIPLWNPYSFSGTPHAANYQSAVFSPVNILFFIFPFLDAWSLMVLLQPLFAALGMYLCLRSLKRSREGSLIGAVAFMFCGFMTTWMAYGTLGWAVSFLPWALWAINKGSGVLIAGFISFSFFSGHFQISFYALSTIIAYVLFLRNYRLFVFVLLGILVAAPQLLLTFDAYVGSTRNISIGKIEVIPWQYLVTLFAPDFYGNPVTRNDWFGHYAEWASYIGIVPLLFAFIAMLKKPRDDRLYFILVGIAALLFAFPTLVNDLLYWLRIPVLSTSANSRIIVLFSFALAALSSFGLDDLTRYWKKKGMKKISLFAAGTMICIGVFWLLLISGRLVPADWLTVAQRNSILPTALFGISIFFIYIGYMKHRYVKEIVIGALICMAFFDSWRYASKWMPFESRAYVYPEVESAAFLKNKIVSDRVLGNIGNEFSGIFGLPIIEGYDALYQGRYAEFVSAASTGLVTPGGRSVVQFDKHAQYKTEVLKLLGIRYIYHRMSDGRNSWTFPYWEYVEKGDMKIIYNDEKYQIFEYPAAYPRAFLASGYLVTTDKQDIVRKLFSGEIDTRETLILEKSPGVSPETGDGSADIISYKPNSVSIKTSAQVPKLLFLADVYDPGWHATVDGNASEILRADYDFRAVAVPAGSHTVELYYFPEKLTYGFLLSLGAFILLLYADRHLRSIS